MKGAIGVFLGFLILNSGFANTEAPVISRDSKTPKAVLANTPYTIRFEVLNRGSQPLTIVPPSASLMGNHAECGISKFTPSPIQTGRKGSIEVQCSWSSAGMNSAFRRKELTIATAPYGTQKLVIEADVYRLATHTTSPDTCAVRKPLNCDKAPKRVRRLCYYGHDFQDLNLSDLDLAELCPETFFDRKRVGSFQEVQKDLETILNTTCDRIEAITLLDHGNSGLQTLTAKDASDAPAKKTYVTSYLTKENADSVFQSGRFECMLTDRPRLIFGGCSVGEGCEGRIFMSAVATALAPTKPIQVTAASTTAYAGLSRILSRTGSGNARDVVLEKTGDRETWSYRGLRKGSTEPLAPFCRKDVLSDYAKLKAAIAELAQIGCTNKTARTVEESFRGSVEKISRIGDDTPYWEIASLLPTGFTTHAQWSWLKVGTEAARSSLANGCGRMK